MIERVCGFGHLGDLVIEWLGDLFIRVIALFGD